MKNAKRQTVINLERQKQKLLSSIKVPGDGLPGSLSMSRFRCGKAGCHCYKSEGHENWTLTYMREGTKRVKHIPAELVEYVREKVEQSKTFKEELNEILGVNAELLILLRKQKRQ